MERALTRDPSLFCSAALIVCYALEGIARLPVMRFYGLLPWNVASAVIRFDVKRLGEARLPMLVVGEEMPMETLDARTVFFVKDAERALRFYTETLGFKLEWTHHESGRPFVFQVSLFGFQLILNQEEDWTVGRAGHGRVFIAIYQTELEAFRRYLSENNIQTTVLHWGAPTLVIRDLDGNELFTWLPESEHPKLLAELASAQSPA